MELDTGQPFRALPRVTLWHHQAHRTAMLGRERFSENAMGQNHIVVEQGFQRQVGGVLVGAVQGHETGLIRRLGAQDYFARRHPLPVHVELRPACDAVKIAGQLDLRQGVECLPVELDFIRDHAEYPQIPTGRRDLRRQSDIEHRKIVHLFLSRWNTRVGAGHGRPVTAFRKRGLGRDHFHPVRHAYGLDDCWFRVAVARGRRKLSQINSTAPTEIQESARLNAGHGSNNAGPPGQRTSTKSTTAP